MDTVSARVSRVLTAKGLRAFGDGFVSLLLPVYLLDLGFGALQVGLIATATLLGSGLLTLVVLPVFTVCCLAEPSARDFQRAWFR